MKWCIFTIAAIGSFIAMLDSTTVNLALYPMAVDMNVTMSQIQWVVVAYMLILTVFLPFFGKLGDLFAKNKLYTVGFSVFAIGAFLNTTAKSFELLVLYRCIEAVGASIILSNTQAIISSIFTGARRGKALGLNGCIIAIGGVSGPAIGGILIHYFGWHAIFYPSLIIGIVGAFLSYKFLINTAPKKLENFKFDYKGFIYFTVCLFCLLLAISQGHTWGWSSFNIILLGILALIFGGLFYFRDHKINYPLINFKLFEIKTFTFGNLAVMMSYIAMFTNTVLLPFFLQELQGYNPLITGLLILPYSFILSIVAPISGRLSGKYGSRYLTLFGAAVYCLSLLLFTLYNQDVSKWQIIFTSGLMGVGNGLFQSPSNNAIMTSVQKSELGIASGILALSRNMGNILGVALTITLFETFRNILLTNNYVYQTAFLYSYRITMCFGIGFGLLCFTFAYFAYSNNKQA